MEVLFWRRGSYNGTADLHNNPVWSVIMFPEYRDLISQLKTSDRHFQNLFQKHNEIDQKVKNMESRIESASPEQIEALKKEKLALKDEIYAVLKKASATA
jgi:uncharacterized protein YdcH (DUF465 family)